MTEAFKRLNAKVEDLLQENSKLMEQVKLFKGKESVQKIQHTDYTDLSRSFPSQDKMDEAGQTSGGGKDTSNRLWSSTFPKVKMKVLHQDKGYRDRLLR
ncbi:hypothetical protein H5410_024416 [Solanum commersonii]|uniref:Uncharacterized protein n=1 Tax=Solanum commersonii TaxID=4109 RepID=A0A9J5ZLY1_SOLCO|nr:hypothetical protein H5410_024416 [Solanum commersonii]